MALTAIAVAVASAAAQAPAAAGANTVDCVAARPVREGGFSIGYNVSLSRACDAATVVRQLANSPIAAQVVGLNFGLYFQARGAGSQPVNLDGVEGLPALREINFDSVTLIGVERLARSRALRKVTFDGMHNLDVAQVGLLTQVEDLTIDGLRGEGLRPLASLVNLRRLKLGGDFRELDALAPLLNLETLELRDYRAASYQQLAPLSRVTSLTIYQASPTDISPLTQMTALTHLDIQMLRVANYPLIAQMRNVRRLRIFIDDYAQPNVDLSFLGQMTWLEELSFGPSRDSTFRLAWLSPLRNLRVLYAVLDNATDDFAALSSLVSLEHLEVHYLEGRIRDVSPLSSLTQLKTLVLQDIPASDFRSLTGLIHLEQIDISDSRVRDLSFAAGLQNLRELNVSSTPVADLRPLQDLRRLEKLYISETNVRSVAPLAEVASLRTIGIQGTNIGDLELLPHPDQLTIYGDPPTGAALRSLLIDRTTHTYNETFGNQIEYTSAGGRTYLWFPGNTVIVTGEWRLEGDERVCWRYMENSYNPATRQSGSSWECSGVQQWVRNTRHSWAGDVYGLSRMAAPPMPLSAWEDIPPLPPQ